MVQEIYEKLDYLPIFRTHLKLPYKFPSKLKMNTTYVDFKFLPTGLASGKQ